MASSHFHQFLFHATSRAPDTDSHWARIVPTGPPSAPDSAGGPPRVLPVICVCSTDRDLTMRSVSHPPGLPADVVLVSYTCPRCRHFSEHPARVADLSVIFERMEPTGDVLVLGGRYMHCGQPMERASSGLHRLAAPVSTDSADADSLDVYLATRVLRCACGFQVELPD